MMESKKVKRVIRAIAIALVAAFVAEDMAWANPYMGHSVPGRNTLQIPLITGPLGAGDIEALFEIKLQEIIRSMSLTELRKCSYRFVVEERGIRFEISFSTDSEGRLTAHCSTLKKTPPVSHSFIINDDLSTSLTGGGAEMFPRPESPDMANGEIGINGVYQSDISLTSHGIPQSDAPGKLASKEKDRPTPPGSPLGLFNLLLSEDRSFIESEIVLSLSRSGKAYSTIRPDISALVAHLGLARCDTSGEEPAYTLTNEARRHANQIIPLLKRLQQKYGYRPKVSELLSIKPALEEILKIPGARPAATPDSTQTHLSVQAAIEKVEALGRSNDPHGIRSLSSVAAYPLKGYTDTDSDAIRKTAIHELVRRLCNEPDLYLAGECAISAVLALRERSLKLTDEEFGMVMSKVKSLRTLDINDSMRVPHHHIAHLAAMAIEKDPRFFEIFKREYGIEIDPALGPSNDLVMEQFDGNLDRLRLLNPKLYNILTNTKNLANLLKLMTFTRLMYEPGFIKSDTLPPLEFALQTERVFHICDNIYITPITEAFRRHIIFTRAADGGVEFAMELKIPGELTQEEGLEPDWQRKNIMRSNFDVPAEIYGKLGEKGGIIKPYFMIDMPHGAYEIYGCTFDFKDFAPRIIAYEYEDGKRAIYLGKEHLEEIAHVNGITYDYLRTQIVEGLIRSTITMFQQGWYGHSDIHLENFRVIVKGKKVKVVAVDFALFSKQGDAKDRHHELYRVLWLYNRFGFSESEINTFIRRISLEMGFTLFEKPETPEARGIPQSDAPGKLASKEKDRPTPPGSPLGLFNLLLSEDRSFIESEIVLSLSRSGKAYSTIRPDISALVAHLGLARCDTSGEEPAYTLTNEARRHANQIIPLLKRLQQKYGYRPKVSELLSIKPALEEILTKPVAGQPAQAQRLDRYKQILDNGAREYDMAMHEFSGEGMIKAVVDTCKNLKGVPGFDIKELDNIPAKADGIIPWGEVDISLMLKKIKMGFAALDVLSRDDINQPDYYHKYRVLVAANVVGIISIFLGILDGFLSFFHLTLLNPVAQYIVIGIIALYMLPISVCAYSIYVKKPDAEWSSLSWQEQINAAMDELLADVIRDNNRQLVEPIMLHDHSFIVKNKKVLGVAYTIGNSIGIKEVSFKRKSFLKMVIIHELRHIWQLNNGKKLDPKIWHEWRLVTQLRLELDATKHAFYKAERYETLFSLAGAGSYILADFILTNIWRIWVIVRKPFKPVIEWIKGLLISSTRAEGILSLSDSRGLISGVEQLVCEAADDAKKLREIPFDLARLMLDENGPAFITRVKMDMTEVHHYRAYYKQIMKAYGEAAFIASSVNPALKERFRPKAVSSGEYFNDSRRNSNRLTGFFMDESFAAEFVDAFEKEPKGSEPCHIDSQMAIFDAIDGIDFRTEPILQTTVASLEEQLRQSSKLNPIIKSRLANLISILKERGIVTGKTQNERLLEDFKKSRKKKPCNTSLYRAMLMIRKRGYVTFDSDWGMESIDVAGETKLFSDAYWYLLRDALGESRINYRSGDLNFPQNPPPAKRAELILHILRPDGTLEFVVPSRIEKVFRGRFGAILAVSLKGSPVKRQVTPKGYPASSFEYLILPEDEKIEGREDGSKNINPAAGDTGRPVEGRGVAMDMLRREGKTPLAEPTMPSGSNSDTSRQVDPAAAPKKSDVSKTDASLTSRGIPQSDAYPITEEFLRYEGTVYYPYALADFESVIDLIRMFPKARLVLNDAFVKGDAPWIEEIKPIPDPHRLSDVIAFLKEIYKMKKEISDVDITIADEKKGILDVVVKLEAGWGAILGRPEIVFKYYAGPFEDIDIKAGVILIKRPGYSGEKMEQTAFWGEVHKRLVEPGIVLVSLHEGPAFFIDRCLKQVFLQKYDGSRLEGRDPVFTIGGFGFSIYEARALLADGAIPESATPTEIISIRKGIERLQAMIRQRRDNSATRPIFIGIDGDAGVGKTVITENMARENVIVIHADNYRESRAAINWKKLREEVDRRRQGKDGIVVVIEGYMLFMDLADKEKEKDYVINIDFDLKFQIRADYETKLSNLSQRHRNESKDMLEEAALMTQGHYASVDYDLILDNSLKYRFKEDEKIDICGSKLESPGMAGENADAEMPPSGASKGSADPDSEMVKFYSGTFSEADVVDTKDGDPDGEVAISTTAASPFIRNLLAQEIGLGNRGKKMLDIGVGSGSVAEDLINDYGLDISGVDIVESLLKRAEKRGVKVVHASAESLPFPDDSFDIVSFFESIGHMDMSKTLAEAYRVIRPGGMIHITTYAEYDKLHDEISYKEHDKDEIVSALQKAGFTEVYDAAHSLNLRNYIYLRATKPKKTMRNNPIFAAQICNFAGIGSLLVYLGLGLIVLIAGFHILIEYILPWWDDRQNNKLHIRFQRDMGIKAMNDSNGDEKPESPGMAKKAENSGANSKSNTTPSVAPDTLRDERKRTRKEPKPMSPDTAKEKRPDAGERLKQFRDELLMAKDRLRTARFTDGMGFLARILDLIGKHNPFEAEQISLLIKDDIEHDPDWPEYVLEFDSEVAEAIIGVYPAVKFKICYDGWRERAFNSPAKEIYTLKVLESSFNTDREVKPGDAIISNSEDLLSVMQEGIRLDLPAQLIGATLTSSVIYILSIFFGCSTWWSTLALPIGFLAGGFVRRQIVSIREGNLLSLEDAYIIALKKLRSKSESPDMAGENADTNGTSQGDVSQKAQVVISQEIIERALGISENDQFNGTRMWLSEQLVLAEGGRMTKLEIACFVYGIIEDLKYLAQTGFSENTINELVKIFPNSRKIIVQALEMVREDLVRQEGKNRETAPEISSKPSPMPQSPYDITDRAIMPKEKPESPGQGYLDRGTGPGAGDEEVPGAHHYRPTPDEFIELKKAAQAKAARARNAQDVSPGNASAKYPDRGMEPDDKFINKILKRRKINPENRRRIKKILAYLWAHQGWACATDLLQCLGEKKNYKEWTYDDIYKDLCLDLIDYGKLRKESMSSKRPLPFFFARSYQKARLLKIIGIVESLGFRASFDDIARIMSLATAKTGLGVSIIFRHCRTKEEGKQFVKDLNYNRGLEGLVPLEIVFSSKTKRAQDRLINALEALDGRGSSGEVAAVLGISSQTVNAIARTIRFDILNEQRRASGRVPLAGMVHNIRTASVQDEIIYALEQIGGVASCAQLVRFTGQNRDVTRNTIRNMDFRLINETRRAINLANKGRNLLQLFVINRDFYKDGRHVLSNTFDTIKRRKDKKFRSVRARLAKLRHKFFGDAGKDAFMRVTFPFAYSIFYRDNAGGLSENEGRERREELDDIFETALVAVTNFAKDRHLFGLNDYFGFIVPRALNMSRDVFGNPDVTTAEQLTILSENLEDCTAMFSKRSLPHDKDHENRKTLSARKRYEAILSRGQKIFKKLEKSVSQKTIKMSGALPKSIPEAPLQALPPRSVTLESPWAGYTMPTYGDPESPDGITPGPTQDTSGCATLILGSTPTPANVVLYPSDGMMYDEVEEDMPAEPVKFLRNIVDTKELTQNIIEGILSALFSNKEVTFAFNKKLKGLESAKLRMLVRELNDWKEATVRKNPKMKALLARFRVFEYDDLKAELNKRGIDANAKDGLIFDYMPKPEDGRINISGSAMKPVYIIEQEGGFPANYYYPLPEMVAVSLAKELLQWDEHQLREALDASNITMDTFGIDVTIDEKLGILIFKVLPKMVRYDNNNRIDRYTRFLLFIRSA